MFRFISLDCKNIIVNYEQNINQFRSKANGSKKKSEHKSSAHTKFVSTDYSTIIHYTQSYKVHIML